MKTRIRTRHVAPDEFYAAKVQRAVLCTEGAHAVYRWVEVIVVPDLESATLVRDAENESGALRGSGELLALAVPDLDIIDPRLALVASEASGQFPNPNAVLHRLRRVSRHLYYRGGAIRAIGTPACTCTLETN